MLYGNVCKIAAPFCSRDSSYILIVTLLLVDQNKNSFSDNTEQVLLL